MQGKVLSDCQSLKHRGDHLPNCVDLVSYYFAYTLPLKTFVFSTLRKGWREDMLKKGDKSECVPIIFAQDCRLCMIKIKALQLLLETMCFYI